MQQPSTNPSLISSSTHAIHRQALGAILAILVGLALVDFAGGVLAYAQDARAEGPDPYTTVRLELGTPDGRMAFVPSALEFQVGHRYRLRIVNVSPVEHEFDAPEFMLGVESERVEVFDAAGHKVATLPGRPEEIQISPGGRVDWYLMPIKPLEAEMVCDLPGHREAGMKGTIRVH
ncbi:MAG TPA: plastocyanin/azurin family copper-binding protein [bacterium]|nr:plastocyanin/azurin family copper-binding protein [bacterium]